jgi:hypothetical protein
VVKPGRSVKEPERVAVVFVHGQGDQRPMKDVLELAHSVWETEPRAARGDQLAPIWSVPTEEADELPDQRRLVSDEQSGVCVDFYQYYWSHLMHGNRFVHVWYWLLDLFAKKPEEVPQSLRRVRETALRWSLAPMILAVLFCMVSTAQLITSNYVRSLRAQFEQLIQEGFGGEDAVATAQPPPWITWETFFALLFFLALAGFVIFIQGYRRDRRKIGLYWSLFVLGGGMVFWIAAHWHPHYTINAFDWICDTQGGQDQIEKACAWAGSPPESYIQFLNINPWLAGFGLVEVYPWLTTYNILIAIFTIVLFFGGGAVLLLSFLDRSFLSPVMADSARYFRAVPENIEARHAIRRTGVELLERLHDSQRRYDRIIVVAHSLGSVVAYGMLEQFWGKRSGNLTLKSDDGKRELRAVEKASLKLINHPKDTGALADFRAAQRRLFASLMEEHKEEKNSWRISDFVTLGSPLTYGAFLLAGSAKEFEAQARKHRRFALCPPDGEWRKERWRFSYKVAKGKRGPNHAALFAAVRWTNIHFETEGLIRGDIVGGPVAPVFGPGIVDVRCDPSETGKTFAHNEYWRWPGANEEEQWAGGKGRAYRDCPRYLHVLRNALNLFDDKSVEAQLQKMARGAD